MGTKRRVIQFIHPSVGIAHPWGQGTSKSLISEAIKARRGNGILLIFKDSTWPSSGGGGGESFAFKSCSQRLKSDLVAGEEEEEGGQERDEEREKNGFEWSAMPWQHRTTSCQMIGKVLINNKPCRWLSAIIRLCRFNTRSREIEWSSCSRSLRGTTCRAVIGSSLT